MSNAFQNCEMNLSQRLLQMQGLFEKTKGVLAGQQPAVPLGCQGIDEVEERYVDLCNSESFPHKYMFRYF